MSSYTTMPGRAIIRGYAWSINIAAADGDARFATGNTFRAQFRKAHNQPVIAEISTGAGITTQANNKLKIELTAAQTKAMEEGTIQFDLVRTDTDPQEYSYFRATVMVKNPITQTVA